MKTKLLILSLPVVMLLAACTHKNEEISLLKAENSRLQSTGLAKDTTISGFLSAFNEIQSNLDSIKMKEKIISTSMGKNSERSAAAKDRINNDIRLIYRLQEENRSLVRALRAKLKKSDVHISEMERMIDNLSKQIEEKDLQLAQFKDELNRANLQVNDLTAKVTNLNTNLDQLNTINEQKQQLIEQKTSELNTAYYVIGTSDYLKKNKIVTREGSIAGLGGSKELAPEVDNQLLTKVDISQVTAIPIMKKKASVLTTHPVNTYRLTGKNGADSLIITDQKGFWSLSKVLVVNVR